MKIGVTVDLWDWIYERRQEYQRAGDEERVRLTKYWECAHPFAETDIDAQVRVVAQIIGDDRHDVTAAERGRHAQPQRA